MLPFLLATAGKAARVPGGGHLILVGLLRLLSAVVSGCNAAARQVRGGGGMVMRYEGLRDVEG